MGKVIRAAVALTLVTGVSAWSGSSSAARQPEGASQSLFVVDVNVVGTPPPGAAIDVLIPEATSKGDRLHHVVLDTTGDTPPDIISEVGTITRDLFVDPAADIGIDDITYACTFSTVPTPAPGSTCFVSPTGDGGAAPGEHVHAVFNGNVNQSANTTITLTFDPPPTGTCDGRDVTVFLSEEELPTAGPDVILGTPGPDTVNGLGGVDRICGIGGRDTLRGGDGRDRLRGGAGADRLEGGLLGDVLLGEAGVDTVLGQGGNDALDGGTQRDSCNGGTERDTGVNCEVKSNIP